MAYFGLSARGEEQKAAVRALANNKPFTIITGPPGTGKTLLAQAVGLHKTLEEPDYRKMNYSRLQTQIGADIGAIPGDFEGKSHPFVAPFMDNLEVLTSRPKDVKEYFDTKIFFDPPQTVRGRSRHHTFDMHDEAQNNDNGLVHAIGTRPALGSKVVLLGNFAQIDNRKASTPETNGLYTLLAGLYRLDPEQRFFDHINLRVTHRSPVVELVEEIFREKKEYDPRFAELEARGNVEEATSFAV
jgi:predicted ribonuclease YlaK